MVFGVSFFGLYLYPQLCGPPLYSVLSKQRTLALAMALALAHSDALYFYFYKTFITTRES